MRANYFFIFTVVLSAIVILVASVHAEIEPETVIGLWLFDKGTGNVARNYSGNRLHGQIMNDAKWVQGKFGGALEFDGVKDKDNTWYHAALTFDGTSIIIYIDGVNVASGAGTQTLYDQWPARIGSHSHDVGSLFNGFIDEVAYFSEALEEKDVVAIMNQGLRETVGVAAVFPAGKLATTCGCVKGY